jgi:hypothetical protein
VHPAVVIVGILRAVVDDDAAAEDMDVVSLPDVERAEDDCAGREIDVVTGGGVDVFGVGAAADVAQVGTVGGGWVLFDGVGEEEQGWVLEEDVVGLGDDDLARAVDLEGERAA